MSSPAASIKRKRSTNSLDTAALPHQESAVAFVKKTCMESPSAGANPQWTPLLENFQRKGDKSDEEGKHKQLRRKQRGLFLPVNSGCENGNMVANAPATRSKTQRAPSLAPDPDPKKRVKVNGPNGMDLDASSSPLRRTFYSMGDDAMRIEPTFSVHSVPQQNLYLHQLHLERTRRRQASLFHESQRGSSCFESRKYLSSSRSTRSVSSKKKDSPRAAVSESSTVSHAPVGSETTPYATGRDFFSRKVAGSWASAPLEGEEVVDVNSASGDFEYMYMKPSETKSSETNVDQLTSPSKTSFDWSSKLVNDSKSSWPYRDPVEREESVVVPSTSVEQRGAKRKMTYDPWEMMDE